MWFLIFLWRGPTPSRRWAPGSQKTLAQGPLLTAWASRSSRAGSLKRKKLSPRDPLYSSRLLGRPGRGPWIVKNSLSGTPCTRLGFSVVPGGVPGSQKTLSQGPLAPPEPLGRPAGGSLDRKKLSLRDPFTRVIARIPPGGYTCTINPGRLSPNFFQKNYILEKLTDLWHNILRK